MFVEVTKMLLFAAQSSHELLPPDVLEPIVSAIVSNFVTERNSAEVMAVGYNFFHNCVFFIHT